MEELELEEKPELEELELELELGKLGQGRKLEDWEELEVEQSE